jgi:hydroxyquinol 1,2-dioxygenase
MRRRCVRCRSFSASSCGRLARPYVRIKKRSTIALRGALHESHAFDQHDHPAVSAAFLLEHLTDCSDTFGLEESYTVPELLPLTLTRLQVLEDHVLATINADDRRLAEIVRAIISHAHALVRETQPSAEEWAEAVDFLIRVGRMTTNERNEYLLLSDMLGLTSAVDEINFPGVNGATPSSVEGPFHVAAPARANGDWLANGPERARAQQMLFRGRVTDVAGAPVNAALVDVWQADDNGHYDTQDPRQPAGNLRGLFTTNERGEYWFRSVVPSSYPVPTDGPVGGLLHALGRHPMRPAHIHLRVTAAGYRPVTTHAFLAGDQYLQSDAAFAVKDELIVSPSCIEDGAVAASWKIAAPFYQVDFDVRLVAVTS